jgi:PAS domain S-box-containing protein
MGSNIMARIHPYAHTMLEYMPVRVALYDAQNLCLLDANTCYLQALDRFLEPELRGCKVIGHRMTEWSVKGGEADFVAIFRQVAETGESYHGEEVAAATHEGVMTYWNFAIEPVQDANEQIIYLLQTGTEVTRHVQARQQAEQAHNELQAANVVVENECAYLHTLLEQLPEGIMIIDATDGCISYANPAAAQLLGMPLTAMLGVPVHRHPAARLSTLTRLYGRSIAPWNFAVVRALTGERLNSEETFVVQPDGKTIVALMSSAPLRPHTIRGVAKEIAIVFQDITVQKTLEQHKNEFFSVINHELRTPLTIIQGYAEMLRIHVEQDVQDEPFDPFITTAVTNITEQSDQLCRLIEDMLNISRIEHAQFVMQRAPHDLLHTITHVVENQAATSKRTIALALDGLQKTDTLMANFDEERIIQVLHNLINNAIKYSSSDKNIDIYVCYTPTRRQSVLIQVKDQGVGIAASELPHIFKRFHRAYQLTASISGFGIGLYLAKEIIVRHGGHIWVESTEGVGSTFSIEFPLDTQ